MQEDICGEHRSCGCDFVAEGPSGETCCLRCPLVECILVGNGLQEAFESRHRERRQQALARYESGARAQDLASELGLKLLSLYHLLMRARRDRVRV